MPARVMRRRGSQCSALQLARQKERPFPPSRLQADHPLGELVHQRSEGTPTMTDGVLFQLGHLGERPTACTAGREHRVVAEPTVPMRSCENLALDRTCGHDQADRLGSEWLCRVRMHMQASARHAWILRYRASRGSLSFRTCGERSRIRSGWAYFVTEVDPPRKKTLCASSLHVRDMLENAVL